MKSPVALKKKSGDLTDKERAVIEKADNPPVKSKAKRIKGGSADTKTSFQIDSNLKLKFKILCQMNGDNMTDYIIKSIQKYVDRNYDNLPDHLK